jgi:broad specificity phosphatase PhoE
MQIHSNAEAIMLNLKLPHAANEGEASSLTIAALLLTGLAVILSGAAIPCAAQTRIIIARHGAAAYDPANPVIRHGRQDPGLTPEGQQQAARLAELARTEGVTHIYHSPLMRARESAEIVGRELKLKPVPVEGFAEIHLGEMEGKDLGQPPYREQWAEMLREPDKKRPGGESFIEMQARATVALRELLARHPGQTILIVAHGVLNRALLAAVLTLSPREAAALQSQPNARAYIVTWFGKAPATVTWRDF